MWMRCAAGVLAVALLSGFATVAAAQDDASAADVAELQHDGKVALKEGRLDDAVALFHEGLEQSTDEPTIWNMLLGLALAHQLKGDWVLAATNYQAFLSRTAERPEAQTGRWAVRRTSATEDVAKMEPDVLTTHALVSLSTEPSGVTVSAPGTPRGIVTKAPITLYLPPGQHQLELSKDGFAPMLLVVSVDKGQRVTVQRALVALVDEPTPIPTVVPVPVVEPPPAPQPVVPPEPATSPALAVLGWAMAGVGVAGLGAGVVFTVAAANTVSELDALQQGGLDDGSLARDAALRSDLRDLQTGAAAFFAAGGALALGGTLVLLLRPDGPLNPIVGLGSLGMRGEF